MSWIKELYWVNYILELAREWKLCFLSLFQESVPLLLLFFFFFSSLNKNPQHFNVFLKWKRFEMYTSRLKEGQCFHSVLSGEATQGFYFGPQTLSIWNFAEYHELWKLNILASAYFDEKTFNQKFFHLC